MLLNGCVAVTSLFCIRIDLGFAFMTTFNKPNAVGLLGFKFHFVSYSHLRLPPFATVLIKFQANGLRYLAFMST